MLTSAQIFQMVFGILGGSALGAAITGWFSRHKTKAEAELSLTDASTHAGSFIVSVMQQELRDTKQELRDTKKEFHEATAMANQRFMLLERSLWEHRKWDTKVIKLLETLGVDDIDPPPEIWP